MSETLRASGDLSEDGFLGGRIRVLQPKRGFRAAIDSVLLPAAVEARNGRDILDAGAGVGVAALCLLARDLRFRVTGVESQAELAALAAENARRNNLALDVQCADLFIWRAPQPFDQVMTNPPYFEWDEGTQSPVHGKTRANVGPSIAAWLDACLLHLKPGGVVTLIHRAEREADIVAALEGKAGDIEILPLIPRVGEVPKRILVRARKGASGAARRCAGFVLHGDSTKYTEAAEAVLRHGEALNWRDTPD
ncbi:MAG: methyltransferase [Alphaproteobacteria bacterium]